MNCCDLTFLSIKYRLTDNLLPESSKKLSQIEVLMYELVSHFTFLYFSESSLLDPCVSSIVEKFNYLSVLSLLDRIVRPCIYNLLQSLYLNYDLESFDFLLSLVMLLQTHETILKYFVFFSLTIEALKFWLHSIDSQGVYSLFQDFIYEEISAYCFQLLLISLCDCII